MEDIYETTIAGGGPAGLTAALYAGRARMKAVMFEKIAHGRQVTSTMAVENYPGFPEPVKGFELIEAMVEQAKSYGCEFQTGEVKETRLDGKQKAVLVGEKEYRSHTPVSYTHLTLPTN